MILDFITLRRRNVGFVEPIPTYSQLTRTGQCAHLGSSLLKVRAGIMNVPFIRYRLAMELRYPFMPLRHDAAADILEVRDGFHGCFDLLGRLGEGIADLFQDRFQLARRG